MIPKNVTKKHPEISLEDALLLLGHRCALLTGRPSGREVRPLGVVPLNDFLNAPLHQGMSQEGHQRGIPVPSSEWIMSDLSNGVEFAHTTIDGAKAHQAWEMSLASAGTDHRRGRLSGSPGFLGGKPASAAIIDGNVESEKIHTGILGRGNLSQVSV